MRFDVPAAVASFIGPQLTRIVEPGQIELRLGASSSDIRLTAPVALIGPTLTVDHTRERHCRVKVTPSDRAVSAGPYVQRHARTGGRRRSADGRIVPTMPGAGTTTGRPTMQVAQIASDAAPVRHRIGDITLTVTGRDGRPLADRRRYRRAAAARLLLRQHRIRPLRPIAGPDPEGMAHVEGFGGARDLDVDAFANLFLNLFNTATLPFYWGGFEPARGHTDVRRLTAIAHWFAERGVAVKGHPLVWHTVQPAWLLELGLDEVERLQRARIRDLSAISQA